MSFLISLAVLIGAPVVGLVGGWCLGQLGADPGAAMPPGLPLALAFGTLAGLGGVVGVAVNYAWGGWW